MVGGTGTLAYAVKAGIRKVAPESIHRGVPDDLHVLVTDDAHFSQSERLGPRSAETGVGFPAWSGTGV